MIGIWKYNDPNKQTAWYRAYRRVYKGNRYYDIPSPYVRKTKAEALKDGKKLKWTILK